MWHSQRQHIKGCNTVYPAKPAGPPYSMHDLPANQQTFSTSPTGRYDGAANNPGLISCSLPSATCLCDACGRRFAHQWSRELSKVDIQPFKPPELLQSKQIQAEAGSAGDSHSDGVASVGKQNVGESCKSHAHGCQTSPCQGLKHAVILKSVPPYIRKREELLKQAQSCMHAVSHAVI